MLIDTYLELMNGRTFGKILNLWRVAPEDHGDIINQVGLRILLLKESICDPAKEKQYIISMLINEIRSERRKKRKAIHVEYNDVFPDKRDRTQKKMEREEDTKILMQIVNGLPNIYKVTMLTYLSRYDGDRGAIPKMLRLAFFKIKPVMQDKLRAMGVSR